jgi:hypothetical protein
VTFDPTLPGAKNTLGYNTQIGFGLYEGLELVGRLATNDQKCNMYKAGACPRDMIRDFSASLKWSLPIKWLKDHDASLALGMNDVGGAASYFKSYYVVGSKRLGDFDLTLGQAKAMGDQALLSGGFGSVGYRPTNWSNLSVQRVGQNSWVSASAQSPIPFTQASAYVTLNKRLSFPAPLPGIASLVWSPDGTSLLTGANADGQAEEAIRIWNPANGERRIGFAGRFEPIDYADWHPSGRIFASSSAKGTGETGSLVQILPADGGAALYQHSAPSSVVITGLCFCPMTGHLAWHEGGRILVHEIQGI